MLAMCWTGSTSPAGSPKASPWYAGSCSAAPTISQTPTKSISIASSRLIHVFEPRGTRSKSSTNFMRPKTSTRPTRPSAERIPAATRNWSPRWNRGVGSLGVEGTGSYGSLTSTPPARHREYHQVVDTIIAWGAQILAYHGNRRVSNGPIEGINNLLQVLRRVAHGFTNPDNYAARGILVTS